MSNSKIFNPFFGTSKRVPVTFEDDFISCYSFYYEIIILELSMMWHDVVNLSCDKSVTKTKLCDHSSLLFMNLNF